ncbi:LysM peptidoglycan-binding domain-containing protein [Methylovirgula sp. 4M-Z18]|uniref:LysM peptidoglycan-binding domain-containing protein n=1 Tax=Methylovirgula sp. 4M-Z18 TaxID=2293567 RepID=UPI000E2EB7A4|nr:LysM peptidoglycan-binding domain-containing protein [Methylovirgula sp. 4M-Z18]RFB80184.1 LysM peptidoglycan-binding domain-containing protein [Methylovirgula sp. 4M-Z18]
MKAYPAPVLWSAIAAVVVTGGLAAIGWQNYQEASVLKSAAVAALERKAQSAAPVPAVTPGETGPPAPVVAEKLPGAQTKPAASPAVPAAQAASPDLPHFDVVRVEPDGSAVVAGQALADTDVILLDGPDEVDRGKADDNGQFAFVPKNLSPGAHLLTLRMVSKDAKPVDSKQNVTVSVPEPQKKDVIVALAQPGEATKILSDSHKPVAGSDTVAIRSVEAEQKGSFYASGSARPGARVWIYLNDTFVAAVTAGSDGLWSLKIGRGVTPGRYDVRADAVADDGKVLSRAGVTFQMGEAGVATTAAPTPGVNAAPAHPDAATPTAGIPPASATGAAATPPANVVLPEISTAAVKRGDSLWRISRKVYGAGLRYTQIYEANTNQIRNPNLIFPGQIFVLPKDGKGQGI